MTRRWSRLDGLSVISTCWMVRSVVTVGSGRRETVMATGWSVCSAARRMHWPPRWRLRSSSGPESVRQGGPRVRMAVHTGEAHLRDEGSYFGDALDRCGRILAVSHAGQVLISAAAAEVVAGRLPGGSMLLDLGVHRLTDLGPREHLWQLVARRSAREFPPLRSLDAFRHNLPSQLTPLIGRHRDVTELAELISRERLVTLTGSAGVGKTRLALAVAAAVLDRFEGGVWWVELAALSDPDAIGRAAVVAVGAREGSGGTAARQVAAVLGPAAALVVLDNCEHLVGSCARVR